MVVVVRCVHELVHALNTHKVLSVFQALEHIVYYVVLAPHDNEQSDMLHRLFIDPALPRLELH